MDRIVGIPTNKSIGMPYRPSDRLAYMSEWGSRIQKRRVELGYSQTDLARGVGIRPASVNDWESGRTKAIDGANLLKAARFLQVDPEWVIFGKASSHAHPEAPLPKSSQNVTLDPDMVVETVQALRTYWRRRGRDYDIVTNPEDFIWAYAKRLALGDRPAVADLIDFGAELEQRKGVADGERRVRSEIGSLPGGGGTGPQAKGRVKIGRSIGDDSGSEI
jgi:transcriptional regulator with XRE-family HTH domain